MYPLGTRAHPLRLDYRWGVHVVSEQGEVPLSPVVPNRRGEVMGLLRGLRGLPRLGGARSDLPMGDGAPVMVVPGFLTGDGATLVLRRFLGALGHRTHGWGAGFNDGRLARTLPLAEARVEELAAASGRRVKLVGWSLGGVISRELARRHPTLVDRVVTMGTPVRGGPKYTSARPIYERRGVDVDEVERQIAARNRVPIEVPITAIYSRNDAVVSWTACLDPNPDNDVEHIEVDAFHCELGFDPEVLRIVARRLS